MVEGREGVGRQSGVSDDGSADDHGSHRGARIRSDGAARSRRRRRARSGADLSEPADHAGGSVPAGRQRHHHRTQHRRQARRCARPADRGGQSRRRRRDRSRARQVAKSAPDGYTILLAFTGTLAVSPLIFANVGYDPRKDFAADRPDRRGAERARVHPSVPAHSVADLIKLAKTSPGKFHYGSPGIGTVNHLAGGAVRVHGRHQAHARSLQGHRPGGHRSPRRPYRVDVRADPGRARQRHGRNAARARRSPARSARP